MKVTIKTFLIFSSILILSFSGCSGNSSNGSSSTKPAAPTNLIATPGNGQVALSWKTSSGASSYAVYDSTTSGGPYTKVGTTSNTNSTITGLTNGALYYFVVTAVNSNGESGYSNQVNATPIGTLSSPQPPTNLAATAGNAQVLLTWNSSANTSLYNVYEATSSNGFFTKIGSTNSTSAVINTNITNGVTYYFVVTAVNSIGESSYSNQANATPSAALPPLPPTNLTAIAGNTQVVLTWNTSPDAISYNIYYSITSGGPYTKIGSSTNNSYLANALANGVTYYFVVTAVNSNGESGYSNQTNATPSASLPPLPPTNLTATAGNAQALLSWSASTNAISYNIYESATSGGPYTKVGTTSNINYTVTGLTNGVTYYFVVTSVNGSEESTYSNETGITPYLPTLSVTLIPTSGTLNAVNLNSMFAENISVSIGSTIGTVDPTSIAISISPNFTNTMSQGFNGGVFAGYVDIVPAGFLPPATTFSVTTSFTAAISGKNYLFTAYNTFTTVASAGTTSAGPGSSYVVTVMNVTQPSGLASILSGNIPTLAISIITGTVALNSTVAGADGSMILYGGAASGSASPTDISSAFALPSSAIYVGDQFMSFGSATLSVAGIGVPLQNFNLSGIATAGGITNGVLYGVVHCIDSVCSNLGTTVGGVVSQYIDANGNMIVLGTFTGAPNTVPPVAWIGGGDTADTNLVNGIGITTTALLDVTTTSSPLTNTTTLPFVILTQTNSNNMMSMVAVGNGGLAVKTTAPQVTVNYPLVVPGLAQTPFSTAVGQAYKAYFMFGLTNSKTVSFTP
ncbi:MAG: fibronectin type III domain-containing protein [Deltaproteobacteria bacterium]|nr:fibronectin type III domain-containing protein [Deltaproteobacteria bacterium]